MLWYCVFLGGSRGVDTISKLATACRRAWDVPECQNAAREASNFPKEAVVCPDPSDSQWLSVLKNTFSLNKALPGSWECALRWRHLLTTTVWLLVAPTRRSGMQQKIETPSELNNLNQLNQFKLERLPTVNWKEVLPGSFQVLIEMTCESCEQSSHFRIRC